MADSDAANLDELKRLLRRLDKALPQSQEAGSTRAQRSSAHADNAGQGSNATALRAIALASGVSIVVSLSVVTLILHNGPLRRLIAAQIPSKGAVPLAPSPVGGRPTDTIAATGTLEYKAPRIQKEPLLAHPPGDRAQGDAPFPNAPLTTAEHEPSTVPGGAEQPSTPPLAAVSAPAPSPGGKSDAATRAEQDRAALAELDVSQFLRRGLLLLSRGSISAAQLLLERAADLGSGDAAFALATTYDGAPGAPRQGPEVRPNAELALRWYARAHELGVEDAGKRLAELKSR